MLGTNKSFILNGVLQIVATHIYVNYSREQTDYIRLVDAGGFVYKVYTCETQTRRCDLSCKLPTSEALKRLRKLFALKINMKFVHLAVCLFMLSAVQHIFYVSFEANINLSCMMKHKSFFDFAEEISHSMAA